MAFDTKFQHVLKSKYVHRYPTHS